MENDLERRGDEVNHTQQGWVSARSLGVPSTVKGEKGECVKTDSTCRWEDVTTRTGRSLPLRHGEQAHLLRLKTGKEVRNSCLEAGKQRDRGVQHGALTTLRATALIIRFY